MVTWYRNFNKMWSRWISLYDPPFWNYDLPFAQHLHKHKHKNQFSLPLKHTIGHAMSGADSRGAHPARAPLKLEKICFFCVKSWFFIRNTPKFFAPPSAIGKNMIFWSKIVIFYTIYPKNVHASLRSTQFFWSAPPLTWNPGSAPGFNTWTSLRVCKVCWMYWR